MKKGSKIVFITPLYLPGSLSGSEIIILDLAETLGLIGYSVSVITSNAKNGREWYIPSLKGKLVSDERMHGVHVIRLTCNWLLSIVLFVATKIVIHLHNFTGIKHWFETVEILSWGPLLSKLEHALVSEQPSWVILSPFPAGLCLSGMKVCCKHGIPYSVIPFFKKDQTLFQKRILSEILHNAHSIFTPTSTEKKYIQQFTDNKNIFLLPSSINLTFINANRKAIRKRSEEIRKEKNLNGKRIVLFVGNKGYGKGIIDAAECVQKLSFDDIVFIAVGNSRSEWIEYLKKNKRDSIIDIPYVTGIEKYAYYQLSNVLILPSSTDNFPLVFLEAWAFKKPVLAYDYYSMKELVADGSGFLAKPNNISDLTRQLGYILTHKAGAQKAGRIGYDKTVQYTRERVVKGFFLKGI